ncbi:DUF5959 family protein [Streptomyces griseorubiginosus]|uniref:DUF5959 family protein n=1 Tax=Streptomyces griseorubiginosus TaxID=67304 RepID=UPI0033CC41FB
MTGAAEPLDVIVLYDGVQSVAVRLLSPTPQCGYYDAEIVIRSDFVNAAVRTGFNSDDLDDWAALLEAVEESDTEAGETDDVFAGNWPSEGRTAYLTFIAEDPYVVEVHDAPSTRISVRVPIDLKAGWLDAARERLGAVRKVLGV